LLRIKGKPTVLVTAAEHYGAVLNLGFDKTLPGYARKNRLNLTRTFIAAYREGPESFIISSNTLAPTHGQFIACWQRFGPTAALPRRDVEPESVRCKEQHEWHRRL
jgi:hypothetical protein